MTSASEAVPPLEEVLHTLNNELVVSVRARERQARKLARVAEELRATLEERDRLHWHLRKLQELLPVCMDCHGVRPEGKWIDLTRYLRDNDIAVSHGLCPPCESLRMQQLDSP